MHRKGADAVVLNRKSEIGEGLAGEPLEIALCRECGQHYYVGRKHGGRLIEADRDPSHPGFGADYYLPTEDGDELLCRRCGGLSRSTPGCDCGAPIRVSRCDSHERHPDQLKQCAVCGYRRGGVGDPVQEIVHGSDGPNTVIATALHELLPESRRKVLAFADSRQEAAFFAWYAEDSYGKLRDRNLILRAIVSEPVAGEGLSIDDLRNRLLREWDAAGLFSEAETGEQRTRRVLTSILREAMTDERRLSLAGVGLVRWFVALPRDLRLPDAMRQPPWSLTEIEARVPGRLPAGRDAPAPRHQPSRRRRNAGMERSLSLAAAGIQQRAAGPAAQRPAMGRSAIRHRESFSWPFARGQRPVRGRQAVGVGRNS